MFKKRTSCCPAAAVASLSAAAAAAWLATSEGLPLPRGRLIVGAMVDLILNTGSTCINSANSSATAFVCVVNRNNDEKVQFQFEESRRFRYKKYTTEKCQKKTEIPVRLYQHPTEKSKQKLNGYQRAGIALVNIVETLQLWK